MGFSGGSRFALPPYDAPEQGVERRLGFLAGQADVPDDFDRMGASEIARLFEGDV